MTTKTAALAADPAAGDAVGQALTGALALIKSKPWHQSLTVQGALVGAGGGVIVAYGPPIAAAFGLDHDTAVQLAAGIAGVLSSIGGLMAVIGRLRLGGLS